MGPGRSIRAALAASLALATGVAAVGATGLAGSIDGGRHWTPPVVPHRDDTPTEHGFVSLVAGEEGGVRAFWIDGRNLAPDSLTREPRTIPEPPRHREISLRTAWIGWDGALSDEAEIDDRVCDRCPVSALGRGPIAVVAYRDRAEDQTRDISVAWLEDGRWSDPA